VGRVLADDLRAYSTGGAATERVKQGIGQSPLLVVADNAWSSADVEPFRAILGPRARLLVTTRRAGRATELGAWSIGMDLLEEDEALRHLAGWIGADPASLPAAARAVAAACGRLPLAIALVGAMARDGTGWQDLYEALSEADLEFVSSRLPDYPYTD